MPEVLHSAELSKREAMLLVTEKNSGLFNYRALQIKFTSAHDPVHKYAHTSLCNLCRGLDCMI